MNAICTEAEFLKDVADHAMKVRRDDGLHRDLTFRRPSTSVYHFNVTTWPGYLAITGDMGAFVFSRLPDMFDFFRTRPDWHGRDGETLHINLSYWREKLVAIDRGGEKRYSPDLFRENIRQWMIDRQLPRAIAARVRAAVERDVLERAHDGYHDAMRAALDFHHDDCPRLFQDFWEVDCTEYTRQFVWCCYAIPWAIQRYDARKFPATADHESETAA